MYGTMITNNEMVRCQSNDMNEMSEDEHSVRTMIVSARGYEKFNSVYSKLLHLKFTDEVEYYCAVCCSVLLLKSVRVEN